MTTAKNLFNLVYGSNKNFMADSILKYGLINPILAYEISKGLNMDNKTYTYAVSFVEQKNNIVKGNNDLFKTFNSLVEAEDYIKNLKAEYKTTSKGRKGSRGERALTEEELKKPIIEELKNLIAENKKVYCMLNKVSFNGMNREISFYIIKDNYLINLNRYIERILNYKLGKGGLKVSGCGMDMGYSVVSNLSESLYKNYKILKSEWV